MSERKECRILVVDDDSEFRDSTRRLLWLVGQSLPLQVQEAVNGADAMRVIGEGKTDCVLLDHRMPGRTGTEWIVDFLKADSNLAIVMVTGEGDEQAAVNAMKNGAMDYLIKGTITAESIQRAMTNALEKRAMRQTLEQQREMLLTAERQRVMIECLGTVCHHLGQPMTVITAYLDIMKRQETDTALRTMIDECAVAVEEANDVLARLQAVSMYRTEPYLETLEGMPASNQDRILDCGLTAKQTEHLR